MARKYHYIKSQITEGLYTSGGEFEIEETGKEYRGLYHRYYDGEIYTQYKYNPELSKRLIKLRKLVNIVQLPDTKLYDKLNTFGEDVIRQYQPPVPKRPEPTERDYKKGMFKRYFLGRVDLLGRVFEIDRNQYNLSNQNRIDPIYGVISIDWKLTGIEQNVVNENYETTRAASLVFPGILSTITNYSKFYQNF